MKKPNFDMNITSLMVDRIEDAIKNDIISDDGDIYYTSINIHNSSDSVRIWMHTDKYRYEYIVGNFNIDVFTWIVDKGWTKVTSINFK